MARKKRPRLRLGHLLLGGLLGLAVAALGVLGWHWQATLKVRAIAIEGAQHAAPAELIRLAGVDTSQVLFALSPALLEDRLRRHPWVQSAGATRLPDGTLRLAVEERRPVALVVDGRGAPAYYLDANGFSMPWGDALVHDVPLVRGLGRPYHPLARLEHPGVLELLAALGRAEPAADALLGEFVVEGAGVRLVTVPTPGGRPLAVRLGRSSFDEKLRRLTVFWEQVVLPQPRKRFTLVDLRFDGQIVTRESEPAS